MDGASGWAPRDGVAKKIDGVAKKINVADADTWIATDGAKMIHVPTGCRDRVVAWDGSVEWDFEAETHCQAEEPLAASSFGGVPDGWRFGSRSRTEAIMGRRTLADAQWERIEPLLPGKKGN